MKPDIWRGQMRAPQGLIKWFKAQADSRLMSMNAVLNEALREYKEKQTVEGKNIAGIGNTKENAPEAVTSEALDSIPTNKRKENEYDSF